MATKVHVLYVKVPDPIVFTPNFHNLLIPKAMAVDVRTDNIHSACKHVKGKFYVHPQFGRHIHTDHGTEKANPIDRYRKLTESSDHASLEELEDICADFDSKRCVKVPSQQQIQAKRARYLASLKKTPLDFLFIVDSVDEDSDRFPCSVAKAIRGGVGVNQHQNKYLQLLTFGKDNQIILTKLMTVPYFLEKKEDYDRQICTQSVGNNLVAALEEAKDVTSKSRHGQIIIITDAKNANNLHLIKARMDSKGRTATIKLEQFPSFLPTFMQSL